jgi:glutathione peroxidase
MPLKLPHANARIEPEAIMISRHLSILGLLFSLHLATLAIAQTPATKAPAKTLYDYSVVSLDGKIVPLATYKGKALLIVNLASKSIYGEQLKALEDLQKTYADKGLVVVGIPSADFGAEELKENSAIQKYYVDTEHVNFQIASLSTVRGKDTLPLIQFLTDAKDGAGGGEIHWNFTKFLVDRQGHPVLRLEADSDPADPEFHVKIEQVLNGTFKKKEAAPKGASPAGDDDDDGE